MSAAPQIPDFSFERLAIAQGACRVVGVDEVGRGPLCGPVTAAAVWLDPAHLPEGLRDSKRLSAKARLALSAQIRAHADIGIGHCSPAEIDALNILQASFLAMQRAIAALAVPPDHLLIDGNRLPASLPCGAEAVVKGDGRSMSIAAASIIAKTARDAIMTDLAQKYPGYGWERNAGYPTNCHLNAIAELGPTPEHRRSFKPIRKILCPDST
ncbi:MAG: ribonuclease HII [Roseibaca calidilacus]|uniref:Ribonuclease HII n=1 Tax=Roseibaca calidilacus TaxID=1666912 RepID=A0A0N8K8V5_9RHOB|nr:ribonuclease HII [Roseibaca calidilacus]KPP95593.1 MAG: ribonuclease HII [Roseibaca calidilacus]CUX82035.1 RNase HII [Roseibaca calidilacus]